MESVKELVAAATEGLAPRGQDPTLHRLETAPACTDLGNATRLVRRHGADLRYVRAMRLWLYWDGRRWRGDETGEVYRRAKATVRAIYGEAEAEGDSARRKETAKHAASSEAESRIRAMVSLAQTESEIALGTSELDADPWALNTLSGILDLRGGELGAHDRAAYITKLAPVEFDAMARHPVWDQFLTRSLPDEDVRSFIQRAAGYSTTGDTREEVLLFPYGPTATGKSTFMEAVKATLGDYALTADFATFLRSKSDGGKPRSDLARLAGCRLVASVEVDEGRHLAEGLVKLLTGGDTVTVRGLYRSEFEFRPSFKLWLVANRRPKVRDDDDALWRRILQVPFVEQIPEGERDPEVKRVLREEPEARAAILAWLVEGCLAWQHEGLRPPAAVLRATDEYRVAMDPLADFLAECCVIEPQVSVRAKRLMAAYQTWSRESGERWPITATELGVRLRNRGFEPTRSRAERGWRGIGLLAEPSFETLGGEQ